VVFFAPLRFVLRSLGVALRLVSVVSRKKSFGLGFFVDFSVYEKPFGTMFCI
jgi:hypothetical protein